MTTIRVRSAMLRLDELGADGLLLHTEHVARADIPAATRAACGPELRP